MTTPIEPFRLSEDQVEHLQSMIPMLNRLRAEIDRAERAGFDVAELKERYEQTRQLRDGLMREYGRPV